MSTGDVERNHALLSPRAANRETLRLALRGLVGSLLGAVINHDATAAEFASAIEHELADPDKQVRCRAFRSKLEGHPRIDETISAVDALARS